MNVRMRRGALPGYGFFTLSDRRKDLISIAAMSRSMTFCNGFTGLWRSDGSTTFRFSAIAGQNMQFRNGVVDAIGHTPLIRLHRASEATLFAS